MNLLPADRPTMHFVGVTTASSSIMQIFPAWTRELGIEGILNGIDLRPNSDPRLYREAVTHIKSDPLSLGALVTTHKVSLFRASNDIFDEFDENARTLHEVSCLTKRQNRLIGHAMDPVTVGRALQYLVPSGKWQREAQQVLILGSGGSALALSLHLHQRAQRGDGPSRLTIVGIDNNEIEEMRKIHRNIDLAIPVIYKVTSSISETDAIVSGMAPQSLIVNATGLGKDSPGSPTSDAVCFPDGAIVWEFNYRGDLRFLLQAREQERRRGLTVADGWNYFIISWSMMIGQVFDIDIPTTGPVFDRLGSIAKDLRS